MDHSVGYISSIVNIKADDATGYPCLILRSQIGALNGYVGVDPTHPWHGLSYIRCRGHCDDSWCEASPINRIEVHGGLTYSGTLNLGVGVGLVPTSIATHAYFFGFDCAHAGDLVPGMLRSTQEGEYRTIAYVTEECAKLAKQLSELVK